jgi:hypothetical protein
MATTERPRLYPMDARTAAFGDAELVREIYFLVEQIEDDRPGAELGELFSEALERFAPEAEWAYIERQYENDDNRESELAACREGMESRRQTRELLRRHFEIGAQS